MRRLFRQTAIDALSSPEQLDEILTITPLRPVLILGGLAAAALTFLLWAIFGIVPYTVDTQGLLVQNPGYTQVSVLAPTDGEITEIRIVRGGTVAVGDVIARLSMSDGSGVIDVTSLYAGTVNRVNVRRGEEVRAGGIIAALRGGLDSTTSTEPPLEAILYLPYEAVQMIRPGMTAYIAPAGISTLSYGYIEGRVLEVSQFPATDQFARGISPAAPVVAVRTALVADGEGYAWTLNRQPDVTLRAGFQLMGKILIREERPLERVLRGLNDAR